MISRFGIATAQRWRSAARMPLPACATVARTFASEGGIFSRVQNTISSKVNDRKEKKMDEKFQAQVQSLLEKDRLTLADWKDEMEASLEENKWRMKLPGASSSAEVQQVKQQLSILSAFNAVELVDMRAVKGKTKKRVALEAGVDERTVNVLLSQFNSILVR